jgi:trehalose-6-phosphate synthase
MVRERLPRATIITFWHIPWPNPEAFGICPWREEVLEGMLGSSILGFHTQFHCNNFVASVDDTRGAGGPEAFTVSHGESSRRCAAARSRSRSPTGRHGGGAGGRLPSAGAGGVGTRRRRPESASTG